MKYSKKAQMSMFIIVGIVAVLLVAIVVMNANKNNVNEIKNDKEVLEFAAFSKDSVNSFVEKCMLDSFVEGIDEFGMPQTGSGALKDFVLQKTMVCIDEFNVFREQDFELEKNTPVAKIEISEESVRYVLFFPVTLSRSGTELTFEEFIVDYPNQVSSSDFEDGVATKDIYLNTPDGKASLFIPKGTKVSDEAGSPVPYVGLKILDKRHDGLRNSFVVGNLIYEGTPDGAKFSNPVTFTMEYKDSDLVNFLEAGMEEKELRCTYLSDSGMHIPWPSEVDTEKNRLTCKIEHFTDNQITANCGDPSLNEGEKHVEDIIMYRPSCGMPGVDICQVEGFVLCSEAKDNGIEGTNCNYLIAKDAKSGEPKKNAVYMTKYDPNVVELKEGYSTYFGACRLQDWVFKDDVENQCACEVYDWKDANDHSKGKEYRACKGPEEAKCYSSCRDEALLSDVVNDGPIKTDGIADDDDTLPEFKIKEFESDNEKTYTKGCVCLHDATITTADLVCSNVVAAPMTWGWDTASGDWDVDKNTAFEHEAVDGIGLYTFEFLNEGDSCLTPEQFSVKSTYQEGDKITMYFDSDLVTSDDGKAIEDYEGDSGAKGTAYVNQNKYMKAIMKFIDIDAAQNKIVSRKRDIKIGVENGKDTITENPQCVFVDTDIYWTGAGVYIKSDPKDGRCAVDVYNRVLYDCGCPTSAEDIQNCLDSSACYQATLSPEGGEGYQVTPGMSVCADGLPSVCTGLTEVESGGYCNPDGSKECLVNTNLEGKGPCKCGNEDYTSGAALCCGGEIVTADELPQGAPFDCSSRSKVQNTCTAGNANENRVCMPTCQTGYNTITGVESFGSPRCPVVNPDTGFVDQYYQCCQKMTGCTNGPGGKSMSIAESIVEGDFCYYCQADGQIANYQKDSADGQKYCPRPGNKGLPGDSCEYATCDEGLVCCQDGGKKVCTPEDECKGTTVTCGDGRIDGVDQCDYNAMNNPSADCSVPGNCVFKDGEYCPDNTGGKRACKTDCTVDDSKCTCGNMQLEDWERCDVDSAGNVLTRNSESCESRTGFKGVLNCIASCTDIDDSLCTCGDGNADTIAFGITSNEQCDGNDLASGTCQIITGGISNQGQLSCTSDCKYDTSKCTCGDGNIQDGEQCDNGFSYNKADANANIDPNNPFAYCSYGIKTCTLCSTKCTQFQAVGEYCGDGERDPLAGEECDDGNNLNNDGCTSDCKDEGCGDGIRQSDEECDDSNKNNNDGCSSTCKLEKCGDGVKQSNEECDDGNTLNYDECTSDCKKAECGDGIQQPNEECDSGTSNSDSVPNACRTDCKKPSCGDDVVDAGEQCEKAGKGTSQDDQYTCGVSSCQWTGGWCGDGSIQKGKPANEECDPASANLANEMLCTAIDPVNYIGGSARCSSSCKLDESTCEKINFCETGAQTTKKCVCGDNLADPGQYCCDNFFSSKDKICNGGCSVGCSS